MSAGEAKPEQEVNLPVQSQPILPGGTSTAYANLTQIQSYVPPNVWSTEALLDYHAKQKEVIFDNNRILENQQKRQNAQGWAGIVIVAGIVAFGLYLVAMGNAFGKDLVGATVLFLAGYLAGKGEARFTK